jgi:hypothetical protein
MLRTGSLVLVAVMRTSKPEAGLIRSTSLPAAGDVTLASPDTVMLPRPS